MLVVNLFGVPGAGKTCNAWYVAGRLAMAGYSAEYVPELARLATYQDNRVLLGDQTYIFGVQQHYLHTYANRGVDVVVCDSPLPNAFLYVVSGCKERDLKLFKPYVMEVFNLYDNFNVLMRKNADLGHGLNGRSQTVQEALDMEPALIAILKQEGIEVSAELGVRVGVEDELVELVLGRLGAGGGLTGVS